MTIKKIIGKKLYIIAILLLLTMFLISCSENKADMEITKIEASIEQNSGNAQEADTFEKDNELETPVTESTEEDTIPKEKTEDNNISNNEPPEVALEIILGPEYVQDQNIIYYRIKANFSGNPEPEVTFNRDDSNGAWGKNISQINLTEGQTFTLVCEVSNTEGSSSSSVLIEWDNSKYLQSIETQDPSNINFSNPADFYIDVNLTSQIVDVYYRDILIRSMPCSGGKPETPTPTGTYQTNQKIEWSYVERFGQGAYYWTRFYGSYLFHSIPYDKDRNLLTEELEKIGSPASHGCIRLYLEDAKWMYDNLPLGTIVFIDY